MNNYQTLQMTVIVFENTDLVRTSNNDNVGGIPDTGDDGWGS